MRRIVIAIALIAAASTSAHAQSEWQVKAFIGPLFGASTTINDLDQATGKSHATYGASFLTLALHQMLHRSHVTDAQRAARVAA